MKGNESWMRMSMDCHSEKTKPIERSNEERKKGWMFVFSIVATNDKVSSSRQK